MNEDLIEELIWENELRAKEFESRAAYLRDCAEACDLQSDIHLRRAREERETREKFEGEKPEGMKG